MTFQDVATLLALIGGAIYGTANICFKIFQSKKSNRQSDQT